MFVRNKHVQVGHYSPQESYHQKPARELDVSHNILELEIRGINCNAAQFLNNFYTKNFGHIITTIKRFMITDQLVQKLVEEIRRMEVTVLLVQAYIFVKKKKSVFIIAS